VRADLLARADRHAEAAASFREAASLTSNESERALLLGRAESHRVSSESG
jgi:predicted RNA polymerase sigma factor